jgi:hypothetical protein
MHIIVPAACLDRDGEDGKGDPLRCAEQHRNCRHCHRPLPLHTNHGPSPSEEKPSFANCLMAMSETMAKAGEQYVWLLWMQSINKEPYIKTDNCDATYC